MTPDESAQGPAVHESAPTLQPMERFTPEEIRLLTDPEFFLAKAKIMEKVRTMLEDLYGALQRETAGIEFLSPPAFDGTRVQFVKGEHLEHCPYQYLDFPKHFSHGDTFTFRTLFWWGHHVAFAFLLEGQMLLRYKHNLVNRYHQVAGRGLTVSLSPSLWEWKHGSGYTLPVEHDRKSQVSAVLEGRRSLKIMQCLAPDEPLVRDGRLAEAGAAALRAMLPIVTP